MSMKLKMFTWVDKCLHQATGKLDSPFGGLRIILILVILVNCLQLEISLYMINLSYVSIHGHHIYQLFTTVIVLLDQALSHKSTI